MMISFQLNKIERKNANFTVYAVCAQIKMKDINSLHKLRMSYPWAIKMICTARYQYEGYHTQ
jgi:hypothetical protein